MDDDDRKIGLPDNAEVDAGTTPMCGDRDLLTARVASR